MSTRLLTGLVAATAVVALAACSAEDGPGQGSSATTAPTAGTTTQDPTTGAAPEDTATGEETGEEPGEEETVEETSAALQPGEEVPEGMDVHDVTVFQVAIPSAWTPDPPGDEPTLAFWGEDEDGAPAEGAVVAWEPQGTSARSAAEDFVDQLEAAGRQPSLEPLAWPDVPEDGAFLVTFDDELAPGAERHGMQLFAELPQGGLATVLAFATPESFDGSRVPEVLASFRAAP
ncbi:hypothetical protein [uncultured Ornithinimicrobium sp.]|uniref:hypothetical protein n=1 Tax=uncultured Ornithinimicrobium sp. TaxID=259307 RepID=UPI002592C144|nr:hypothetical protein [uncultured Ornithinimicrobium sp.]